MNAGIDYTVNRCYRARKILGERIHESNTLFGRRRNYPGFLKRLRDTVKITLRQSAAFEKVGSAGEILFIDYNIPCTFFAFNLTALDSVIKKRRHDKIRLALFKR